MGVVAMGGSSASGTLAVVALILAVVATILAFVFIVPEKNRKKLNAFGKFLHDTVNFKYLIVEKILQALYIFLTAYTFIEGFLMLFRVEDTWSGSKWYGGVGLLTMILGPIAIRLSYEFIMMFILLVKNVIQINNKLKGDEGTAAKAPVFEAPAFEIPVKEAAPAAAEAPAAAFCTTCGARVDADAAFCTVCGAKLK